MKTEESYNKQLVHTRVPDVIGLEIKQAMNKIH